jgi:hypothetical protein
LVEVISQKIGHAESKAWDGYLVLLTPGMAPSGDLDIDTIRHDTSRLRKLVATGETLNTPGDVNRMLKALMPLADQEVFITSESTLDLLPDLLADHGVDRETTRVLVEAFTADEPLLERLHQHRSQS